MYTIVLSNKPLYYIISVNYCRPCNLFKGVRCPIKALQLLCNNVCFFYSG